MKSSASGLRVRLLTVMMETLIRVSGSSTGNAFSESRSALKCRTERGSRPTKLPVPTSAALRFADRVTTLVRGGSRPPARKIPAISAPGTLS